MKRPEKKLEPLESWTPGDGKMPPDDSCWGTDEDWDTSSSAFVEVSAGAMAKGDVSDHWAQFSKTLGPGMEWMFRMMPGMRGKLYGRSLTPPCRCKACAYTIDTLI